MKTRIWIDRGAVLHDALRCSQCCDITWYCQRLCTQNQLCNNEVGEVLSDSCLVTGILINVLTMLTVVRKNKIIM